MTKHRAVRLASSAHPKVKFHKVRFPRTITSDEVDELLRQPDLSTRRGLMDRCMLELMYRCGLRVSELVNVRIDETYLESGLVLVFNGAENELLVFDPQIVSPLLRRWIARECFGRERHERLFFKNKNAAMSVRYVQRMVARYRDEAGIHVRCTPHTLHLVSVRAEST